MTRHTPIVTPPAPAEQTSPLRDIGRQALMATMIGLFCLLLLQIIDFSASLDALTWRKPSDEFIAVSRIAASLVILLLAKELLLALIAGTSLGRSASAAPKIEAESAPFVSVIIPAYNEAECIERTLKSVLDLDYPKLEIIVVDDGSSDETRAIAENVAEGETRHLVRVLSQRNSGKWKALNAGIDASRGSLILCVDADSDIAPDALRRMVPHFDDPRTGAVSGQVQVGNQNNLLTRLQALEYLVANGCTRAAQAKSGSVLIVPGPIGLFRRTVLDEVSQRYFSAGAADGAEGGQGPFSPHTFAEDFEISVMICALGYRIVYEPLAISRTSAPESLQSLINQRYRWIRGSMQVSARFTEHGWGLRNRALKWWMAIASTGELYIVPLAGLLLLATLGWTAIHSDFKDILLLWGIVWAIHIAIALLLIKPHGEKASLCLLAPLQSLYAVVLLTGVWTRAVFDHAASRPMRW